MWSSGIVDTDLEGIVLEGRAFVMGERKGGRGSVMRKRTVRDHGNTEDSN